MNKVGFAEPVRGADFVDITKSFFPDRRLQIDKGAENFCFELMVKTEIFVKKRLVTV